MTVVHPDYQFIIEENKVYEIRRTTSTNVAPAINISGSGSVNLYTALEVPTSYEDSCFTLSASDSELFGFKRLGEACPSFIKLEQSEAGERTIILSGFDEPKEIIFA